MKHRTALILLTIVVMSFFVSCSKKEDGEKIAVTDIPLYITAAIEDTMPGFIITEAEMETADYSVIYEIEGTLDDVAYEIDIDTDATILEIVKADSAADEDNDTDIDKDDVEDQDDDENGDE